MVRKFDISAIKNVFQNYRLKSSKRGIKFSVKFDEFMEIATSNCYYCGDPPSNIRKYTYRDRVFLSYYNGIDRVDNNKGYVKGNMVPCCRICNKIKSDTTLEVLQTKLGRFLEKVTSLLNHGSPGSSKTNKGLGKLKRSRGVLRPKQ